MAASNAHFPPPTPSPHTIKNKRKKTKSMAEYNNDDIKEDDPFITAINNAPHSINNAKKNKTYEIDDVPPTQTTMIAAALSYAISSIAIQVALKMTLTSMSFPSSLFVALAQCVFTVSRVLFFSYHPRTNHCIYGKNDVKNNVKNLLPATRSFIYVIQSGSPKFECIQLFFSSLSNI